LPIYGKFTYENGDTYEGNLKNSKPQGTGILKDSTGIYSG
jgi:hypothetical protein